MIHRYGSIRNAKQRWRGVVIAAPGGRKVRAVARGKIEFAGRLNGYGYLIIIRHDKSYRSLYAYNRAIYKKTGQTVNAGEVIAAVGNSGGQAQNALYFEIRRGTRLQNPSRWCR
jgi:septal ring factor EnvC (AmiA/AmiB activator)